MRTVLRYCAVVVVLSVNTSDATITHARSTLRVCADPDNLPFSNAQEHGFENRVADLIAHDLGARVEYTWWPQRRGFLRNTLNAGSCDIAMALPTTMSAGLTTRPYYRSSYVFVTRAGQHPGLMSFDDARLHELRIGVQLVGDDGANSPPAHALSRRGIVGNVTGFPVYYDPSRIVRSVASGEIDVAIVWGPLAGYYAAQQTPPLRVMPVVPQMDSPALPMAFDISMVVRSGDRDRRTMLDALISRRRADIDAILAAYHVPRTEREESW
jgi:mxaJ protein